MQITLIGSGNVATVLGRTLALRGHRILEVYSRREIHAQQLADELGASAKDDLQQISQEADIYIIAVTDDALPLVASHLRLTGGQLAVHTAGSVALGILEPVSINHGVLWPVKMIRSRMPLLGDAMLVADAVSAAAMEQVLQLAGEFSADIIVAGDAERLKMHMLASLVANFPNHLYHLAADYCEQEGIDFRVLQPIILDTARQVALTHPKEVQAGPAFRGDKQTVARHLFLLEEYPNIRQVYQVLSASITAYFGKKGL